jgi:hypothetical protein
MFSVAGEDGTTKNTKGTKGGMDLIFIRANCGSKNRLVW